MRELVLITEKGAHGAFNVRTMIRTSPSNLVSPVILPTHMAIDRIVIENPVKLPIDVKKPTAP